MLVHDRRSRKINKELSRERLAKQESKRLLADSLTEERRVLAGEALWPTSNNESTRGQKRRCTFEGIYIEKPVCLRSIAGNTLSCGLKQTRMPILMRRASFCSRFLTWLNALFHKTFGWEGFGKPRDLILVEGKSVLSASAYAYLLAFAYACERKCWGTYWYLAGRKSTKGSGLNRSCKKNY